MQRALLIGGVVLVSGLGQPRNGWTAEQAERTPASSELPRTETVRPADYVIGPGDVLGVLFWQEPEMSGDFVTRPDGKITLPLIGTMRAAGLTPEALSASIHAAATEYLTDLNVTVVVREFASHEVFITGKVARPNAYALTSPRTVMQLIALAGGLLEWADANGITILRTIDGQTNVLSFNYEEVARGERLSQNVELRPGDTVIVP